MLKSKLPRTTTTYDTDTLMLRIWKNLARDFRTSEGHDYAVRAEHLLDTSVKDYRDFRWPARSQAPIHLFKREYQLEHLFKRYKFAHDKFSEEDLLVIANEKFVATQLRIAQPLPDTSLLFLVLQKARKLCHSILGDFSNDELVPLCRFGKRATVGNPKRVSYLDLKLAGPITGSRDQIRWFQQILADPRNSQLLDALIECHKGKALPFVESENLSLTNVPKSYKSLRSIMPNTLIGSFRSYGLGKMIERRLRATNLDIRHLQKRHG